MSGMPAEKRTGYTWEDYSRWSDDKRWELIGGEVFDMTAAPLVRHQAVSRELEYRLMPFFAGKQCEVFDAPIDVKLSEEDVVQPDLIVVCNPHQIKETHIEGPPTLVVEILSPSRPFHDRVRKMGLYAKFGVKEFWVVTPEPGLVEVFLLDGASYRLNGGYGPDETVRSPTFPKLKMSLSGVFDLPGTPAAKGRKVKEAAVSYSTPRGARGPARYRQP